LPTTLYTSINLAPAPTRAVFAAGSTLIDAIRLTSMTKPSLFEYRRNYVRRTWSDGNVVRRREVEAPRDVIGRGAIRDGAGMEVDELGVVQQTVNGVAGIGRKYQGTGQ